MRNKIMTDYVYVSKQVSWELLLQQQRLNHIREVLAKLYKFTQQSILHECIVYVRHGQMRSDSNNFDI